MIKQEELRAIIDLLGETKIKTGFKFKFCLKEPLKYSGYSTKDTINLLKAKRGDSRGKD